MSACGAEQRSALRTASTTAEIAAMYLTNNVRAKSSPYRTLAFCKLFGWMMDAMLS
jgi:hypothetical protein